MRFGYSVVPLSVTRQPVGTRPHPRVERGSKELVGQGTWDELPNLVAVEVQRMDCLIVGLSLTISIAPFEEV